MLRRREAEGKLTGDHVLVGTPGMLWVERRSPGKDVNISGVNAKQQMLWNS